MAGGEEFGNSDEVLKLSYELDTALTCLPEKLTNLENLLALVLSRESDIKGEDVEEWNVSPDFIEKASAFHLLFAILIFELKELDSYLTDIQDGIVETLHRASAYAILSEFLKNKFYESKDLLRRWQKRVLRMNIQLLKLEMTSLLFRHNDQEFNWGIRVEQDLHLATSECALEALANERRQALRLLEVSLLKDMELEKLLSELKQNEEDLRLRITLKEHVSAGMEGAAEAAWSRFLEADNAAAIWMGISKEMLMKLRSSGDKGRGCASGMELDAEVIGMRERIKMLEEKLGENGSQLEEAKVSSKGSQLEVNRMNDEIASLRESLFAAESRATSAEEKVAHLSESNLELTEELDFLKGSNDSIEKKASILQKQVREFDIELQHAKASSEANQEQQNMLYSAIFDMETLIDELKQKVSKAELNAETAEERCIILSEKNAELSKEIDVLRSKMEFTQTSLDRAVLQKECSMQELSRRSTIIMDMVLQLAVERERIHEKLTALTRENKLLRERSLKEPKSATIFLPAERYLEEDKELLPAMAPTVQGTEISSKGSEVHKPANKATSSDGGGIGSFDFPAANLGTIGNIGISVRSRRSPSRYTYMAIVVLLLSILTAHLFHRKVKLVD